jgi:hypothetical protein
MAIYSTAAFQTPVSSSYKTMLEMLGGTGGRLKVFEMIWSCSGTPADNALVNDVIRITATGTGTAVTPTPLDPADVAAAAACEEDSTAEPTTTGIALLEIPVNQRATVRWVAREGSELVVAATANFGFAFRVKHGSYTAQSEVNVLHQE